MSDNAINTYRAVEELRPRLPEFVGSEDWPALAAELDRLDEAWAAAGDEAARKRIAMEYRDALAPWPRVYERMRACLDGMSAYTTALRRLAVRAEDAGEIEAAEALRTEAERHRLFIEQGVGEKAYSLRFRKQNFLFWKLPALGAAVLSAVVAVTDPAGGALTMAVAILSAVASLEAMVEEVPVDDASVFLGLVEAAGESRQAALPDIMAATNAARAARPGYLLPMDEAAVKTSLQNLFQLRSIKHVSGDTWRVNEEYGRV